MRLWVFMMCILVSLPVFARTFPVNSHVGKVVEIAPNQITIARIAYRTAPGLRVFNQNNALIFIRQLPIGSQIVYQIDTRGELFQIWMLTAQEIAERPVDQEVVFPPSN